MKKIFYLLSKLPSLILVLGILMSVLVPQTVLFAASEDIPTEHMIVGKTDPLIAIWDVGTYEDFLNEYLPDATVSYYYTSAEMALAVKQNKADAMVIGRSYYEYFIDDFDGLTPMDVVIGTCDKALIFSQEEKGERLMSEVNEFMAKCHEDGTMEELAKTWFTPNNDSQDIDFSVLNPDGETIIFGSDQSEPPYCLRKNETLMGFDIDFMVRFCGEYGYNLDIRDDGYDAITAGIQTGKYDVVGAGIEYEKERAESVNFSDSMYVDDVIILVPEETESLGFLANIKNNFEKTFIREGRFKLFIAGFGRTVLMSVLSCVFGTLIGFILYFLNRDGGKAVRVIITIFVNFVKLVPIIVILMMLYYIIFGNIYINGVWVAVITFSLIFGASVFEVIESGVDTVDKGQTEAAYALGFSKNRTFFKILLPQSSRFILPMYKDELIKMIEETSVVGYIAIQDLTRISDLVRAQTFEPFFPLIATAVVYVLIAFLVILAINALYNRINTKNRSEEKILKGIGIYDKD